MTIAHEASTGSPAGFGQGSTSCQVAFVGSPGGGKLAVLRGSVKPETATFGSPSDATGRPWTLVGTATGGTGSTGGDTGPTRVGVWVKELVGDESGNVTIPNTGGNSCAGAMTLLTKGAAASWDYSAFVAGDDSTHDAGTNAHGATCGAWSSALAAGDWVDATHATDTDTALGSSGPAFTQSGAVFGAATLRNASRSGTANDCGVYSWDAPVTTGSASAPTFQWTGATAECGPYLVLRLREVTGGGGGGGGGGAGTGLAVFDGVTLPKLAILASFGGNLDPGADYLHLGTGPGLGTGKLGGVAAVDVTADVVSVTITRGRDGDLDPATPGVAVVVLDGRSGDYDPTNPSNPFGLTVANLPGTPLYVRCEWPLGTIYERFSGEIADFELDAGNDPTVTFTAADGLEKLGRAHVPAGSSAYDGDTTGARIGHLADLAGWPTSLRALDAGYTTLGPLVAGEHALPLMAKTEKTEYGLLWVDGAGYLVFYDRHRATVATRSTVVQAAFTDTGGASDVEMTALAVAVSREGVFTEAHVLRDPGLMAADAFGVVEGTDDPVEQAYADPTAPAALAGLSFPDQVGQLLRTDFEALAMCQYLVARYETPAVRIREVTVDATTQDRYEVLLPLRLLDLVSASRDYGPNTVTAQLHVQGMVETITDQPLWSFVFKTSVPPPTPSLFVLGTSALGGSDALGW